jgi:hypothetical protein
LTTNWKGPNGLFGELIMHLQRLDENILRYCDRKHMFIVKHALACKDDIWLVRLENSIVRVALKLAWTDIGGKKKYNVLFLERRFFDHQENPIAKVV